jgi:hypothetical protein
LKLTGVTAKEEKTMECATMLSKAGDPVMCIQGGAKLSGSVVQNLGQGLLIQWRDFPHPIAYTRHQVMSMGMTRGQHTFGSVIKLP